MYQPPNSPWFVLNGTTTVLQVSKPDYWSNECSPMVRKTEVQSQFDSYQKTQKIVLDAALLITQHSEVMIKRKRKQSWNWSSAFPYTSVQ